MKKQIISYLQIALVGSIIFGAIWFWVNYDMTSDGKAAHAVFDKIIEHQPELKVAYHEKSGYFPCLEGEINGISVHVYHKYQSRRKNKAGYLFITFWGKNKLVNKKHWFSLSTSHSRLLDSEKSELRNFSEAGYNETYQLRDKEDDFALKIFDNTMMEQLSNSIKDGEISIFLDEGNLKFIHIEYFNTKDEKAIEYFSQLIDFGIAVYQKALKIEEES